MAKSFRCIFKLLSVSPLEWRSIFWARRRLFEIDRDLRHLGLNKAKLALEQRNIGPGSLFRDRTYKQITRTIDRAARLSIRREDSCLRRSLLLWWVLQSLGVTSKLRIGVSSKEGTVLGHAWLEVDGRPVNDRQGNIEAYRVIDF